MTPQDQPQAQPGAPRAWEHKQTGLIVQKGQYDWMTDEYLEANFWPLVRPSAVPTEAPVAWAPPEGFELPWHLEGPITLDGKAWGSSMAIVTAGGRAVAHQFHSKEWESIAKAIIRAVNTHPSPSPTAPDEITAAIGDRAAWAVEGRCPHGNFRSTCLPCAAPTVMGLTPLTDKVTDESREISDKVKGTPKLWKSGGAGGQDQYAGLPPMIRYMDEIINRFEWEMGKIERRLSASTAGAMEAQQKPVPAVGQVWKYDDDRDSQPLLIRKIGVRKPVLPHNNEEDFVTCEHGWTFTGPMPFPNLVADRPLESFGKKGGFIFLAHSLEDYAARFTTPPSPTKDQA